MKTYSLRLLFVSCLLLLPFALLADAPPPPAAPPRPASLVNDLQTMPTTSVAEGSVVLTVLSPALLRPPAPRPAPAGQEPPAAAPPPEEAIPAPEETVTAPLEAVATPEGIAAKYGRAGQWFGHVFAVAPPTMTVLNTSPALADLPLSLLASQHPTPFLIGSFSPAQLRQMATTGLAYSEMTTDQQALVKSLLPHPLMLVPKSLGEPANIDFQKPGADIDALIKERQAATKEYDAQGRTISEAELTGGLRLHGFLASEFTFDSPAGSGISMSPGDQAVQTTGTYKLAHGGFVDIGGWRPEGNPILSYLKAETANVSKDGDFNWNRHDLEHPVILQGVKTVNDLTARLAKATGLELYADTHYGPQPVLVIGSVQKPIAAGDAMQALALCVCGAWRQVGPAYVLTDDVQGLGTRQEFLREMVQTWSTRLTKASEDVGGRLRDADWLHTLHFADGDPWALGPEQLKAVVKERGENSGHLPWKDLPAPLQTSLRGQLNRHFPEENMKSFEQTAVSVAQALKPDTSVGVALKFQLAISLPDTGAMKLGEPYRVQMPRDPPSAAPTGHDSPGGQRNGGQAAARRPVRPENAR